MARMYITYVCLEAIPVPIRLFVGNKLAEIRSPALLCYRAKQEDKLTMRFIALTNTSRNRGIAILFPLVQQLSWLCGKTIPKLLHADSQIKIGHQSTVSSIVKIAGILPNAPSYFN